MYYLGKKDREKLKILVRDGKLDDNRIVGEINGFVTQSKNNTELLISSYFSDKAKSAIDKFLAGDDSEKDYLLFLTQEFLNFQRKEEKTPKETLVVMENILKTFKEGADDITEKAAVVSFEYFLSHYARINCNELSSDENRKKIGLFHVHPNGNPPSEKDISESKSFDIPMYVISPRKDLLRVYSIFNGESKLFIKEFVSFDSSDLEEVVSHVEKKHGARLFLDSILRRKSR